MDLLHRTVRQHIRTQLHHRTILKLLRHINDRLRILNFVNADLIFDPCINKLHGYASVFLLVFNYIRKVSRKSKALFLVLRVRDVAEHPVDVRFATTGVERRPLCFRQAGLERTKKGYPPRISFFVSLRARDGTRTRDPDLGKVVLHQLSHSRILNCCLSDISYLITGFPKLQALFKVF